MASEIDKEFKKAVNTNSKTKILHGLSERLAATIEATINDAIEQQRVKSKDILFKAFNCCICFFNFIRSFSSIL